MGKRILFLALLLFALLDLRQNFNSSPIKQVEISKEATTAGQIASKEMATVAYVFDGDTIKLTDGRRVRYIGIDTPEIEKCFSTQAKEENKRLVEGKTIWLEKDVSDVDSYGRLLRYVFIDDMLINEALVYGGFARAWNVPPDEKYKNALFDTQREARGAGRGLWQMCR